MQNPAGRGPGDPGLEDKAEYPPDKQQEFGAYSWIPAKDTQVGGQMNVCLWHSRAHAWPRWPCVAWPE
jgi:hypothetical protein